MFQPLQSMPESVPNNVKDDDDDEELSDDDSPPNSASIRNRSAQSARASRNQVRRRKCL